MKSQSTTYRETSVPTSIGPFDVSRYDLVLAVIPCSFLLAALASWLFSLPTQASVVAASFACSLAVVDALFVNPPGPRSNPPDH